MDFYLLLKIWVQNLGKNISKNWSGKDSHKLLDHAKQSASNTLKTASKRALQKSTEATCDLIGNKIDDKITKLQWICSKTVTNEAENIEHNTEIPKERYIPPEKGDKIIDDLILI